MSIVHERHGGAVANAYGVAWLSATGRVGVVAGGGWATVPGGQTPCPYTDTDTDVPDADDGRYLLPVMGSAMDYDPGTGKNIFRMGFAAPPGTVCCVHLWTLVP